MTLDPILDEPFHWCAFQAMITEARAAQGWPDPEKTRQRAYALYEARNRKEPPMSGYPNFGPRPTDEDYEVMEDKRLARQGIDPDGDPIRIMQQAEAKLKELRQKAGLDEDGNAVVDRPDEPR